MLWYMAGARIASVASGLLLGWVTVAVAADKLPTWYTEPPRDSAEALWGTGEGPDIESARRSALRAVAARLRSAVSGTVSSQITVVNGKVSTDDQLSLAERVLETEFSRADVTSSAPGGRGVFVLVKVDRPVFLRDTRNQLDVLAQPIHEAEAALPKQSTLDQFVALRRLGPQIERAVALSQLLAGAGAETEGQQGARRYGDLLERGRQLASKLTFELRAGAADADIATAVGGFLAQAGMRSASGRTAGATVLIIESQSRQDDLFGSKLLKLKVRLAVVDDYGRAVASREYEVAGSSRNDFRGAREAAVVKLATTLREAGPVAGLGFKE